MRDTVAHFFFIRQSSFQYRVADLIQPGDLRICHFPAKSTRVLQGLLGVLRARDGERAFADGPIQRHLRV